MKAYTDIEQSKKLAKILPLESADLYYNLGESKIPEFIIGSHSDYKCYIPCWSLAALLSILGESAYSLDEDGAVCLRPYKCIEWDLSMENTNLGCVTKSNPVDACYEMIIKLHEQNLL